MIPDGFLHELLSRVDIVDVVGRRVELKRSGANHMGLCPFHAEKSPSFSVNAAKQFYHCFGCGAHGDAIRFLMEHSGASFRDAVAELAQPLGMAVPDESLDPAAQQRALQARAHQATLTEVLQRAATHYRTQLKQHPQAVDYLKRRGLSGEIAARFALGYAPPGWRSLASGFARYDDPLLVDSGLVIAQGDDRDAEQKRYDRFRDRIMFPIRSVKGEVIGFGGRVLDGGEPKYLNSPETPVFVKGRELYGLYEARTALRSKGHALVVEGYMDVVALAQHGFANAVATLGTACSAEHVQKLFRFTDTVIFSFDGDAAGRRAAARALEAALPHATDLRSVRFLFLPSEHDPDSFVRAFGAAAFAEQLAKAVPLSRQLIEQASQGVDLGSAEGRARMLAQAKPLWLALPQGALRRQLLPELARQAQLDSADLAALWGQRVALARGAGAPLRAPARAAARHAPAGLADQALRLLLAHNDWWDRLSGEDQGLLHGLGGLHGEVLAWLERQLTEHGAQTSAALSGAMHGEAWAAVAQGWLQAVAAAELHHFEDLQRVLQRMWVEALGDEAQALASAEPDAQRLAELRHLRQRIAELKAGLSARAAAERHGG
ncbi:MAG TPA: DNA primase [Rubrivivax sp.]|nr:DNA primase [Rubrivivax sp.]HPO18339.1 DNA primase [Rubrivivax sp.]